jgi:hypothetical protein
VGGPSRTLPVCFATLLVLLRAVVSRSPSLSRLAGAVVLRFSNFEGATAVPTHKRKRSRGASKVASQTRAERSRRGSGGAGSQLMVARWRSITAMRAFRILRTQRTFWGVAPATTASGYEGFCILLLFFKHLLAPSGLLENRPSFSKSLLAKRHRWAWRGRPEPALAPRTTRGGHSALRLDGIAQLWVNRGRGGLGVNGTN